MWNILNTSIPFFSPSLTLQQLVSNGQYTYSQQIYFVMDNWYNIAIASPDKQTDPIWTQLCNQAEKNFWNSAGNGKVSNPDAGYLGDISSLISTLQGFQHSTNLSNPSQSDLLPLATAINALYSSANQECNDKADGYALFISEFMNISFTSSGTLQSLAASITSPNPSQADLNVFYSILYPDSTNPIYQGLLTALQNIQNNCYC